MIAPHDIRKAAARLGTAIVRTPVEHSRTLSAICGAELHLKFEIFQFTASFKERGALNRLLTLTPAEAQGGVVAMSAGNHAQGLAYHARRLGIPATIVMPRGTPFTKVRRTEELGARVDLVGDSLAEAANYARACVERDGVTFIHPYDDPAVIAGQGTVALEFLEQCPGLDVLCVPVGGGGLIAGMAIAAKAVKPAIRVIGVQSEACPGMHRAIAGLSPPRPAHTVAEGIAVADPGQITRGIVREHVDDVLVVSEAAIERAMTLLVEVEKVVTEGAGAAALAAVLEWPERFGGRAVGLPLTGGNVDSRTLATCLMRGLVRDGRVSRIRVITSDAPGSLATVMRLVAERGGNVLDVAHHRHLTDIHLKDTELEIEVETKDRDHAAEVRRSLQEAGYDVIP